MRINEWDQFLNECNQSQDECREMFPRWDRMGHRCNRLVTALAQ